MSLFLVLQDFRAVGEVHFKAGDLLDDAFQPIASLQAAGAALVAFNPATMTVARDKFLAYRGTRNDIGGEYLSSLMLEAGAFGTSGNPIGVAGGDLSATYPNPTVVDFTITDEALGSVLYFDGSNWVQLPAGTPNQVFTTQGLTTAPIYRDIIDILPDNLVEAFQVDGTGEALPKVITSNTLVFKSIAAGTGIVVSSTANEVVISLIPSSLDTIVNVGTGAGVLRDVTSGTANLRSLLGSSTVAVVAAGDEITMSVVPGISLPIAGGTMTGAIDMGGNAISNAGAVASTGFTGPLTGDVNTVSLLADGPATQFLNRSGAYSTPAGNGDFSGPASSATGNLVSFADTTGKLGADSGVAASDVVLNTLTLTAGAGLTGFGDLSADRTVNVVANADGSMVINADDIQVGVLDTDAQHGLRGGGTQHALAIASGAAGFLSGADKAIIDGLSGGPFLQLIGGTMSGDIAMGGNDVTGAGAFNGVALTTAGTGDLILGDNGLYKVDIGRFAGASGWLAGGIVTQASATTIDVTSGSGRRADYVNPADPDNTEVPWTAKNGVSITAVASSDVTLIAFDSGGNLVQFLKSTVTRSDFRTHIFVGEVGHAGGAIEGVASTVGNVAYDGQATLGDFLEVIGPTQRNGVEVFANAAGNLTLDHDAGELFIASANVRIDPTTPDLNPITAASPLLMRRVFRDNLSNSVKTQNSVPDSNIDPTLYCDGSGTLQAVAGNDWSNQRIFVNAQGTVLVGFAQNFYNTKALALDALNSETFSEQSPLPTFALRAFLTVKGNAADLTDPADAQITRAAKFRLFGTSGGGIEAAGSFLSMTDTPSSYSGQAGKSAVVNDAENALEFQSIGGGGSVTFEWIWDTATADADPGSGNMRGNNATQASITQFFISDITANGKDLSEITGTLTTSDVLVMTEEQDTTRWIIAVVSSDVTDATGYFKVPVGITQVGNPIRDNRTVAVQVVAQGGGGVPPARQVIAGLGLVGGGDLSADRTFDIVATNASIVVNANDITVGVLQSDAMHGLRGGGTQHALAIAAGAAGFLSGADKTKLDSVASGAEVNVLPSGYMVGVHVENNSGTPLDKVDIAVGRARDSTDAFDIPVDSILSPSLAVSGANGLDTGTRQNTKLYALYIIDDSSSPGEAGLFSLSATSPTLPGSFDMFRRVATVQTNSIGNLDTFLQSKDEGSGRWMFRKKATVLQSNGTATGFTATSSAGTQFAPLSASHYSIDAQGEKTTTSNLEARIELVPDGWNETGGQYWTDYCGLDTTDQIKTSSVMEIPTGPSGLIRYRVFDARATLFFRGYKDQM